MSDQSDSAVFNRPAFEASLLRRGWEVEKWDEDTQHYPPVSPTQFLWETWKAAYAEATRQ
jgi:hypothetical protein